MLIGREASGAQAAVPGFGQVPAALLIGAVVLCACLVGIYTRPVDFLATVWPANAIMLGMLLRFPATAKPFGWGMAALGFLAADLLIGSPLFKTLILTAANLVGVGGAYFLLRRYSRDTIRLKTPESIPLMVAAIGFGAFLAGLVGAVANPVLFGGSSLGGWSFWFVTEFANYVAILPVMLTARRVSLPKSASRMDMLRLTLPALALVASCAVSVQIGGPGAIAFPVPALLWSAIVYPRFLTVLLTSIFSFWSLLALSAGYFPNVVDVTTESGLISMRLGVSLIALAPMMLASAMAKQKRLIGELSHLATHDTLSGVFNRGAFQEEAATAIRSLNRFSQPFAALMIDIDHFKAINDRHGHAAGDQVIAIAAARINACLRRNDIVGRVGGEEFAVLLSKCRRSEALEVAERIRSVFAQTMTLNDDTISLTVTLSVGLAASEGASVDLDTLLEKADGALYRAKDLGRNRIEVHQLHRDEDAA